MIKMKKILLGISVLIFLISCIASQSINNREKFQSDHTWCIEYSNHPGIKSNRPNNTQQEIYKECMQILGY